jgi:hypothetical protein
MPAPQAMQLVSSTPPARLYLPAAQLVQDGAPAAECVPAGQLKQ